MSFIHIARLSARRPHLLVVCRYYSDSVVPRQRNWRLEGHVPPPSLVQADHSPLDLGEDELPRPRRIGVDTSETPTQWLRHRERLKRDFPEGWNPQHKLSRKAMEGLRSLHALDKEMFSTPVLANKFKVSPEAVRRILRSKWEPSKEKRAKLAERERRDREERVLRGRIEEKRKKIEILLGTKKHCDREDNTTAGNMKKPRRSIVKDELFFQ